MLNRKWLTPATLGVLLLVGSLQAPASADSPPKPPVWVTPGNSGSVTIGVNDAGSDGGHDGSKHSRDGRQTHPCRTDPGSAACVAYEQANLCSTIAADWAGGSKLVSLNNLTPPQLASLNAALAASGCPPYNGGPAPPTAAQLAQSAYGQLSLPDPVPSRYPTGSLKDGRPYTIVQTHMWFWSDPSVWKPLSKTVCAGALCATATARPSSLSFDPGNGDQPVSCAGPGTAWVRPAGGSWVPTPQPQGCDYQYTTSTYGYPNGELTAAYTITWGVRWTGTNGTSGTLNPLATTVNSTFAVAELQSVVSQ